MHRTLVALALALPLAATAQAPATAPAVPPSLGAPTPVAVPPAKLAKIEQLIKLLGVDTQLQDVLASTKSYVHQITTQRGASAQNDAQKALVTDYVAQGDAAANEILVWAPVKDRVVQAYASNFTDADLDGAIAFFGTQAGKDFIAKSPVISGEVEKVRLGMNQQLGQKLQAITRDFDTKYKAATPITLSPLDTPSSAAPATSTPKK